VNLPVTGHPHFSPRFQMLRMTIFSERQKVPSAIGVLTETVLAHRTRPLRKHEGSAVEIVVDGKAVARKNLVADGQVRDLEFEVPIARSGWIAARILPSSHSNPIFVIVNGKPMRPLRASAEWCLAAVDQSWTQNASKNSSRELPDAHQTYDHARQVYRKLIAESDKQ
jgi:hypothetical protein